MSPDDSPHRPSPASSFTTEVAEHVAGEQLGAYHLLQKIGEGGMGEVWVAEQREPIRRTVAVKVIKVGMDTRQVVARFEAERQALAVMDHPGIAKVLDAGTTARGRAYFVMEYVRGEPITTYCDRQRLSTPERLTLFTRVCEAVQHAHQKGIIHRDLKPSNVLVTIQDDQPVPKIIDFGIAKAIAQRLTEQTVFTELGVLIGTPEYMSPEQAEMSGLDVDTRTDVYSLGVMLYELLTGVLPFDPRTLRQAGLDAVRKQIREVDPPRPSTKVSTLGDMSATAARNRKTEPTRLVSELKGDLDWVTMKALEKDRTRRYGSASDLAADIRRHRDHEPLQAGPPGAAYRARKFARRHAFGVAAAGAFVVLLAAFAVAMAIQSARVARERDNAVAAEKTAREVSSFLIDLFRISDPTRTLGRTITAREILDRGAARVSRDLASDPLVQARLMNTLGRVYDSLGLFDQAQPLLEGALATRRKLLGEANADVASSLAATGTLWWHKGEYTRAKPLLQKALAIDEKLLPPDDPMLASSLHNLGTLDFAMANYDEAQRLLERARAIREKKLPPGAADTLSTMNTLAAIAFRKGEYASASRTWEDTLAARERTLGPEHPHVAQTLNNLAVVHIAMGDAAAARPLLERVVRIQEKTLGPQHPDLAFALNNLGDVQFQLRAYPAARDAYQRAVDILESVGPNHPELGRFLTGLGSAYVELGDTTTAREYCRRGLEISEKAFGKNSPQTAHSLVGLANCERCDRQYASAEALFDRALAVWRRPDGRYAPDAARALFDYATLLRETGRGAQAAEMESLANSLRKGG